VARLKRIDAWAARLKNVERQMGIRGKDAESDADD